MCLSGSLIFFVSTKEVCKNNNIACGKRISEHSLPMSTDKFISISTNMIKQNTKHKLFHYYSLKHHMNAQLKRKMLPRVSTKSTVESVIILVRSVDKRKILEKEETIKGAKMKMHLILLPRVIHLLVKRTKIAALIIPSFPTPTHLFLKKLYNPPQQRRKTKIIKWFDPENFPIFS